MYLLEPREKGQRMKSPPSLNKGTATARDAEQGQEEGGVRFPDLSSVHPLISSWKLEGRKLSNRECVCRGQVLGTKQDRGRYFY